MRFLDGLDDDIRQGLLQQLKVAWTHHSTAIEGNSIGLFDMQMLIQEGLTVGGKTLREHHEVIGHARCVDLIYDMLGRDIVEDDLFALHKAVQLETVMDIFRPMGAWKVEPNGVYVALDDGGDDFHVFAAPEHVPSLMSEFIAELNSHNSKALDLGGAAVAYAKLHTGFVSVHPFWDGNGRLARLLSNIPVLNAGFPPILVNKEQRPEYIRLLATYQREAGEITPTLGVWPRRASSDALQSFFSSCYTQTAEWVKEAHALQQKRDGQRKHDRGHARPNHSLPRPAC